MPILLLSRDTGCSKISFRKILVMISILFSSLFAYGFLSSNAVHQSTIRSQWQGLNVIHSENSIYGNITVTQSGEQYTFFADGVPSVTTPVSDTASLEDFVHFPMLFHEKPDSVLILNGGAGGMIREILKYPVKRVDYVELDPVLLKLIHKYPTPLTESELVDKRVEIHYTDARLFLQKTEKRFDVIFIGLSSPQSLETNRLFSSEFFSITKKKMNPNGILVFTLPGSHTYISPELGDLNGCMLNTVGNVYRYSRVIPGDVNLFLASDSDSLEKLTSDEISKRFEERKIQTRLITRNYLVYRLNDRWLKWFSHSMEGRKMAINSDFHPMAVFFNLSYWNSLFSPYLMAVFKWFERSSLELSVAMIILVTVILGAIFMKWRRLSIHGVTYSILTTGLTGMIFNLAVIFSFQTVFGFVYHQIGFLIAIFMLGIASGSVLITKRSGQIKNAPLVFLKTEIGIILFSFLFPYLLLVPSYHLESKLIYLFLYVVVLILSFLSGMPLGVQFPLASEIYLNQYGGKGSLGQTAGLLYAADLLGGFLGGLCGGILLLPILGLKQSCFIMGMIKTSSFVLFLIFMNTGMRTKS
jgi:spermidine synthase